MDVAGSNPAPSTNLEFHMVSINRVYQHHSGSKYCVIGISNQKATKNGWNQEAVYIDEDGNLWTRNAEDFEDSQKFTLTDDKSFAKIVLD